MNDVVTAILKGVVMLVFAWRDWGKTQYLFKFLALKAMKLGSKHVEDTLWN